MDRRAFDSLTRAVAASGTRRAVLAGLLAALGLAPGTGADARPDPEGKDTGKGKGGRGGKEHGRNRGNGNGHGNGRNRKGKRCNPTPDSEVCAGKCGPRTNNCGQRVQCEPCRCGDDCPDCTACNPQTDVCDADLGQDDLCCGGGTGRCLDGQCVACGADRACEGGACCVTEGGDAGNLGCCAGLTLCADGTCKADCCAGVQCPAGERCAADGACRCDPGTCAGCCDGIRGCRVNNNLACGSGGGVCQTCAPGQVCDNGTCVACSAACGGSDCATCLQGVGGDWRCGGYPITSDCDQGVCTASSQCAGGTSCAVATVYPADDSVYWVARTCNLSPGLGVCTSVGTCSA